MKDRENLDVVAEHSIRNYVGRAGHDQFARLGQPARSPKVRMIAQCVDGSDETDHESFGGDWIIARDKISNRLQVRECGAGPMDPQPFAEYFPTTRATSDRKSVV